MPLFRVLSHPLLPRPNFFLMLNLSDKTKFWLGLDRGEELVSNLRVRPPVELAGFGQYMLLLLLATLYFFIAFTEALPASPLYFVVNVCLVCCLLLSLAWGFCSPKKPRLLFKENLRFVHTAFAIGCAPAIIWFLSVGDLDLKNDLVRSVVSPRDAGGGLFVGVVLTFLIAAWAALTEEIVFRGALLSGIRRIGFSESQGTRDTVALLLSSSLFGLAHYPAWGLSMSVTLAFIGFGLGLGYLATNESLLPVVVYHFGFNFLSLVAALVI